MTFPGGIHPFWFWNGRLEADEIRRQVADMAAQGVRGFFIHSRQGLEQPYLSESFFEMVDAAIAAAAQHGMSVQLYDEFPYPSGAAGGETTLGAPEFLATHLSQVKRDVKGAELTRLELPRGKVLSCSAYPLRDGRPDWGAGRDLRSAVGMCLVENTFQETGLTAYNRKRYLACRPTPVLETTLPQGSWRVYASVQTAVERHKYWGGFPDVLNPAAVARFIELTHERYRARYEKLFGARILSIFTDETAPGWSALIPRAFQEQYGYDLLPMLPALQDESHPDHLRVKADLERLRHRLFCETFEAPIAGWTRRHGLMYAAEKPVWRLAQLRYQDVPSCDAGHTKVGARPDWLRASIRHNARAVASAAYFYDKPGCLCECYHSLGWGATLQDAKFIADGLLMLGINTLVPHGFFYTTHNLRKHDAPPSFFYQMPYWRWWGRLSQRIERALAALKDLRPAAEILVVEPSPGLPTKDMSDVYERAQEALMNARLDFLMVDTDILEGAAIADGHARIKDVSASVAVVPPMRAIEPALAQWLERFVGAGGRVVRLKAPFDARAFVDEIMVTVRPSLALSPADGLPDKSVWMTTWRDHVAPEREGVTEGAGVVQDGRALWFILNTSADERAYWLDGGAPVRERPLDEGLPPRLDWREGRLRLSLAPFESVLLEAQAANGSSAAQLDPEDQRQEPAVVVVQAGGPARVKPLNPNALRLAEWDLAIEGQVERVVAAPLANQLAAGRFRFAPSFALGFGVSPQIGLPKLTLRYACVFGCEYAAPVMLVMEPGSIEGAWRWRVNEEDWRDESAFVPGGNPARENACADVTAAVQAGMNRLEVEVETSRPDGGLLNPLYLEGDFAVEFRGPDSVPWLTPPKSGDGWFERYAANGLPYYKGVIEYESQFTLAALPAGEALAVELRSARPFQEAAEVSFNGGPWRPALWEPRLLAIPRGELRAGPNQLRARVYTTLCRFFEGQWFDPVIHAYRAATEPSDR